MTKSEVRTAARGLPRLLILSFPTWGRGNQLHLTGRGDRVVLAPDEFPRLLVEAGWAVDVVSLAGRSVVPLHRSGLPPQAVEDIDFDGYDLYWHMFRDPTQPEVLDVLARLGLNYAGKPIINEAGRLREHRKDVYLRRLAGRGLAPEILDSSVPLATGVWTKSLCTRVSLSEGLIETHAFNNNRGDYPERGRGHVVTRFIDNSRDGLRSIVRFGVAFGQGFRGFQYWSDQPAFKSGGAQRAEPYEVPELFRAPIAAALREMGCDVCHVEAVPLGERLYVFDVNPYPTADGHTLTAITQDLVLVLRERFETRQARV